MLDEVRVGRDEEPAPPVVFCAAGERAKGEFCCTGCGYGVAIATTLPTCPMCGGERWRAVTWRPFTRTQPEVPPL